MRMIGRTSMGFLPIIVLFLAECAGYRVIIWVTGRMSMASAVCGVWASMHGAEGESNICHDGSSSACIGTVCDARNRVCGNHGKQHASSFILPSLLQCKHVFCREDIRLYIASAMDGSEHPQCPVWCVLSLFFLSLARPRVAVRCYAADDACLGIWRRTVSVYPLVCLFGASLLCISFSSYSAPHFSNLCW